MPYINSELSSSLQGSLYPEPLICTSERLSLLASVPLDCAEIIALRHQLMVKFQSLQDDDLVNEVADIQYDVENLAKALLAMLETFPEL